MSFVLIHMVWNPMKFIDLLEDVEGHRLRGGGESSTSSRLRCRYDPLKKYQRTAEADRKQSEQWMNVKKNKIPLTDRDMDKKFCHFQSRAGISSGGRASVWSHTVRQWRHDRSQFWVPPISARRYVEENGLAAKTSAGVTPEVSLRGHVTHASTKCE